MKSITVNELAINSLSHKFSRFLDDNTLVHYAVPFAYSSSVNKDAISLLKDYLSKEAGEEIELIVNPKNPVLDKVVTVNVSKEVFALPGTYKLKRQLGKKPQTQFILMENTFEPLLAVANFAITQFNKLISLVNSSGYFAGPVPGYQLYKRQQKVVGLTHFMSVAFSQYSHNRALQALTDDLKLLASKGLIKGHLALPTLLQLSDTLGIGEKHFVVFCYPILDRAKIFKLLKLDPTSPKAKLPLEALGIKYETTEGAIKWFNNANPADKYKIFNINIADATRTAEFEEYNQNVLKIMELEKSRRTLKVPFDGGWSC